MADKVPVTQDQLDQIAQVARDLIEREGLPVSLSEVKVMLGLPVVFLSLPIRHGFCTSTTDHPGWKEDVEKVVRWTSAYLLECGRKGLGIPDYAKREVTAGEKGMTIARGLERWLTSRRAAS